MKRWTHADTGKTRHKTKHSAGANTMYISTVPWGCGDAPKLNDCEHCKSYDSFGHICPDARYGNGDKAKMGQTRGWTCAAFRQIGASQE